MGRGTCSVAFVLALLLVVPAPSGLKAWAAGDAAGLAVNSRDGLTTLSLGGLDPFHRTDRSVVDARTVDVPGTPVLLLLWHEVAADGTVVPCYAISLDGARVDVVRETSYELKLRYADFDPLAGSPEVEPSLASASDTGLYLVQFVTQPLEEFRAAITRSGGTVYHFVANHAHIVKMTSAVREEVAALPFVRAIEPLHPAYRLEEVLRADRTEVREHFPHQRYNIMVLEDGRTQKDLVAKRIEGMGGVVDSPDFGKFLLVATLTPEQLYEVVRWDEVLFVDRWSPMAPDMNNARTFGGADYIESVAGFTGQGVRGEVFDTGFNTAHVDFQSRPLLQHTTMTSDSHGASTSGIVFGDGTGNANARGMLPSGQGIAAVYTVPGLTGPSRYTHTAELLGPPYYAVFQTSSVGSDRVTQYTTLSADHDALLFDLDLTHTQSQSNAGDQMSRPQAWAKNVISGGAAYHYDTLSPTDDHWGGGASIGPATDNRVKPDLCAYYDDTLTTTTGSPTAYTTTFGGTSGATPIIAGHVGLFFQMWSEGIFGNEVIPGGTVFENRSHMTTAKAALINTARQYDWLAGGPNADITRYKQGWGWPDVHYLYDMREKIGIIDETELLQNLQSVEFAAYVEPGEPALKATMTYADPAGVPNSSQHRINDLTLRVTSPSGTIYWGNNGLITALWSTPGGSPNTIDTVENVFIQNPQAGVWTIQVIASEINQDGHVESPELDADFALVVTGAFVANCTSQGRINLGRARYACSDTVNVRVVDCDLNTDDQVIETTTVTITSDTEPAGEIMLLTETAPASADFRGTIELSTVNAAGVLQVGEGDEVTAIYIDADDGQGNYNVEVTATGAVDCTPPIIGNVQTINIEPHAATVTFTTDEDAGGTVHYGLSCSNLNLSAQGMGFNTAHAITLGGLNENATYYFSVEAEDEAGNSVV
ncbi:MAG TPA: S8 family serine peptidase, partial [Phycisphaerae bacterium]|nr:S8 family serine peptidase [Phycisphaerae bacterium]HNU46474.1 S8 family serine peptidase [Phycisphaerae bacterium]